MGKLCVNPRHQFPSRKVTSITSFFHAFLRAFSGSIFFPDFLSSGHEKNKSGRGIFLILRLGARSAAPSCGTRRGRRAVAVSRSTSRVRVFVGQPCSHQGVRGGGRGVRGAREAGGWVAGGKVSQVTPAPGESQPPPIASNGRDDVATVQYSERVLIPLPPLSPSRSVGVKESDVVASLKSRGLQTGPGG